MLVSLLADGVPSCPVPRLPPATLRNLAATKEAMGDDPAGRDPVPGGPPLARLDPPGRTRRPARLPPSERRILPSVAGSGTLHFSTKWGCVMPRVPQVRRIIFNDEE